MEHTAFRAEEYDAKIRKIKKCLPLQRRGFGQRKTDFFKCQFWSWKTSKNMMW